jgi:hypothetical protein
MPTNEGGTHGLCERMRSYVWSRRRTLMNAGIQRNLTGLDAGTCGRPGGRWGIPNELSGAEGSEAVDSRVNSS